MAVDKWKLLCLLFVLIVFSIGAQSCDTVYTQPSGTITSPNYPANYNNSENCNYEIRASQSSSFTLTFTTFQLEGCSSSCSCDWVQIQCHDGSTVKPKYCGSALPSPVVINNCNEVMVWFRSDGSNTYKGFSLQYSFTPSTSTTKPTTKVTTKPTTKTTTKPTTKTTAKSTTKTTAKSTTKTTTKPTTKTTAKSTTKTTTKPTTKTTAKSTTKILTTTEPTTRMSTISMTTTSATTNDTTGDICLCEPSGLDDVPLIVVSTFLAICILGYIVLATLFMIQRYRQRTSNTDARSAVGARTANEYATTPPASGILYENFPGQNVQSGNSLHTNAGEEDYYQHLRLDSSLSPRSIYENLPKQN